MAVMVGLWQNFIITIVSSSQLHKESAQNSPELVVAIKSFCHTPTITAISWMPSGFHNFFTLAILCRAARLGHTFFTA